MLHRSYEGTHAPVQVYWYNDFIEIRSPGGPYGHLNERNFGQPGEVDYRNPTLAEVMRNLGLVQKFGTGIPIAREALAKNGSPELEFDLSPSHVKAVVRKRPGSPS